MSEKDFAFNFDYIVGMDSQCGRFKKMAPRKYQDKISVYGRDMNLVLMILMKLTGWISSRL